MGGDVSVTLPRGLWREGACHPDALLRPVTGADEAFLAEEARGLLPAERTTQLLARCLVRLGPARPVSDDDVRELTTGDREALLLHLRRITFGERLELVLACPAAECAESLEVALPVAGVLVEPYEESRPTYEATVVTGETGGAAVRILFRLPTGADQEQAARRAEDVDRAVAGLLEACLVEVGANGRAAPPPAAVVEGLPQLLAAGDPQAEIVLELACPACGEGFATLLDAGDFLERELAAGRERLFEEVHLLARAYGWRERDILALPVSRRRRYASLFGAEAA